MLLKDNLNRLFLLQAVGGVALAASVLAFLNTKGRPDGQNSRLGALDGSLEDLQDDAKAIPRLESQLERLEDKLDDLEDEMFRHYPHEDYLLHENTKPVVTDQYGRPCKRSVGPFGRLIVDHDCGTTIRQ